MIEIKLIAPRVFLAKTKTARELCQYFIRFEEHYESPEFKGKIFSIKAFKEWYKTQRNGRFTYYSDWSGFNIPSYVFKAFLDGEFNPLSQREKTLLHLLSRVQDLSEDFYVIGVAGDSEAGTLEHECAHALFYLSPKYKSEVLEILTHEPLDRLKSFLTQKGYHESVILDECNAYLVADHEDLKSEGFLDFEKLSSQLKDLFQEAWREYKKVK